MRLYLLIAKYIAIPPIVVILMIKTIYAMQTNQNTLTPIDEAAKIQTRAFIISVIVIILSAIATSIVAVWLFRASNSYQDAVKQDADAKIALADTEAAKANEGVANANLAITESKEETAKANAEAAKANEGLAKSDEKIAGLNLEAETAKKERAEADKQIATAKTDAAKANNETAKLSITVEQEARKRAEAELALLELKERLRPRVITPDQRAQLLLKLKQCPVGKIDILYPPNSLEAENFAKQLSSVLNEANWTGELLMTAPFPYNLNGLAIETNSNENLTAMCLHRAMWEVGLEAPGKITPELSSDSLYLIVGGKP
jgi:chemotaxis protein histidine kinase CheA